MKKIYLILSVFIISLGSNAALSNWQKINDEDGIVVSKNKIEGTPVVGFRGQTIMDAPLEKILHVLLDNEHRKDWVDRLKVSRILERQSNFEYIIYQEFKLPWPLSNRDFIYKGKAVRNAANGQVTLEMSSIDYPQGPKTVGVRADLKKSIYRLTPMGPNKTQVEVEILSDPKGLIPNWLVNLIQKSWPLKTLRAIRNQLDLPYVKLAELPPV